MEAQTEQIRSLFDDFGVWTVLQSLAIVLVFFATYRLIRFALPRAAELLPTRFRIVVLNAIPLARLVLLLAAALIVIPLLFNITFNNVVLLLGAVGVAIGFALKEFATSAFAGLVAVFERPYRTGDWVRIGNDYGEVIEIGSRAIKLRTADDDVVTIPHSRIWSENIVNSNNGEKTLMCVAEFILDPVATDVDLKGVLRDVALISPYLDWSRPVRVVTQITTYGVQVKLRAYPFEIRDQFAFVTDLTERGRRELGRKGATLRSFPDLASPS